MTRHEALKALMAMPDPQEMPKRSHQQIYEKADRRKLDMTWRGPLELVSRRWFARHAA